MRTNAHPADRGASIPVFLVGVVLAAILATVIVIAVRRHAPPPTVADCDADRAALQRAEDELHTQHDRYGTESELVAAGLLDGASSLHDVSLGPDSFTIVTTGACGLATSGSSPRAATMHLVFGSVPATVTAGRVIAPAITVTLTDEKDTTLHDNNTDVTLSMQAANGARLSGTTTVRASAGVATFTDLAIDKAGTGYMLVATAAGAMTQSSTPFTVETGSIAKLRFVAAPATATPGDLFTVQPVVEVEDVMGNVIAGATDPIELTLTPHRGASGARLTCESTSVMPVDGVATFGSCAIDRAGVDYSLNATMGRLRATSDVFPVIGQPSQLVILQQPAQVLAGVAQTVVVAVEDSAGNVITDSDATVSVAINKNSSALTGTTSVAVVDGVATFSDLAIATSASGYSFTFKADGLHSAVTVPFDVVTAPATQLVFTRQPSGGRAGKSWGTQPIVGFADAFGNVVASGDEITLQVTPGTGTAGAAVLCTTNPLAATNGEARFFKCSVDLPGTDYTLTATSGALAGVSAPFSIT